MNDPHTTMEEMDFKIKYEKLKEFVRGKWKGDCSECAALANSIFNQASTNGERQ